MKNVNAMFLTDMYKLGHRIQYPEGTELVYSTFTPRDSRIPEIKSVVSFGQQRLCKKFLINYFNDNFFTIPKRDIVNDYKRFCKATLGDPNAYTQHLEDLHDLGYLPIEMKSLPEGMSVPIKTPVFTIQNTDPKFFWLTNYLETLISAEMWGTITSATLAKEYKKILTKYAQETASDQTFVNFQSHDFSMRGMKGVEGATLSGLGHLTSFWGSDTIPSIIEAETYYNANLDTEPVGFSVAATEHSVMCASGMNELDTFTRLLTEVYPTGILSVVSDTWDFWAIVQNTLPTIKDIIMKRDGKLVIRPDSGDPVKIICGDEEATDKWAKMGLVESLWEIFGGTVNSKGYKDLDAHIGCIYGDSITLVRAESICSLLRTKGFSSTNVVFGVGSYTYQYNTRDTFGFALKSTLVVINGDEQQIFKNPKTDNGIKKSQKGAVVVYKDPADDTIHFKDGLSLEQANNCTNNLLTTIFKNGKLVKETSLAEIRERVNNG